MLIQPIFAKYLNRLKCKTLTEWCKIIPAKLPVFRPIFAKMAAVFLLNTMIKKKGHSSGVRAALIHLGELKSSVEDKRHCQLVLSSIKVRTT